MADLARIYFDEDAHRLEQLLTEANQENGRLKAELARANMQRISLAPDDQVAVIADGINFYDGDKPIEIKARVSFNTWQYQRLVKELLEYGEALPEDPEQWDAVDLSWLREV